jgi:hypothetical protein
LYSLHMSIILWQTLANFRLVKIIMEHFSLKMMEKTRKLELSTPLFNCLNLKTKTCLKITQNTNMFTCTPNMVYLLKYLEGR